jgi:hypothetical protein
MESEKVFDKLSDDQLLKKDCFMELVTLIRPTSTEVLPNK